VGKFDKALPGNPTTKFPANSKHSEGGDGRGRGSRRFRRIQCA